MPGICAQLIRPRSAFKGPYSAPTTPSSRLVVKGALDADKARLLELVRAARERPDAVS